MYSCFKKADNSKTVPYAVTTNGKYTFIVSGIYNGKIISEEKEVTVNQFKSAEGAVQYDAGDWTKEEVENLQKQGLYNINKEKAVAKTVGLDFTFGGFTYKEDIENASDIANGNIITSRNQSVAPKTGYGAPKYSRWQILTTETKQDEEGNSIKNADGSNRIYVTKITHAGSPENFVYCYTANNNNMRAEYLLSSGKRQIDYGNFNSGTAINPRSWQMYVDKKQKDLIADTIDKDGKTIKDVHAMNYEEAENITGSRDETNGMRNTGGYYWLASSYQDNNISMWHVNNKGKIYYLRDNCIGIRPVVTMAEGVYIKSGSGTDTDPYILGKD